MPSDPQLATFARLGPGARLGRFTIKRSAGIGGMAAVWCAEANGERVALKTILPTFGQDHEREHAKMFREEGAIASRIHHPNLCRVIEVGEADGLRYLAMEWIDGGSLATLARPERIIPSPIAVRIVADVARGLHAAHVAGIVHRDVSPHNILVDRTGRACIADFGVAKVAREGTGATASGFVKGKVRYMAPEQAYAEPVDARTDVFALGIVLLEAVTGANPLAADTDVATLTKIASIDAVPVPEDLPPSLAKVIVRAVDKNADARFATMAEMADALDAITSTADVAAWVADRLQDAPISEPRPAPSRATRLGYLAIAAGVIAAIAVGSRSLARPALPITPAPVVTESPPTLPPAIPAPPPATETVSAPAVTSAPPPVLHPKQAAPVPKPTASAAPPVPSAAASAPRRDPLRTRD